MKMPDQSVLGLLVNPCYKLRSKRSIVIYAKFSFVITLKISFLFYADYIL